jgi:hypothetical protein
MMKRRLLSIALTVLALMFTIAPSSALAQEEGDKLDGKVLGYPPNANLGEGSTALSWILLLGLIVIVLGVMKMDAKRSHLD